MGNIAVFSKNFDQTSVCFLDNQGTIMMSWVHLGGVWNPPSPIGPARFFQPGGAIALGYQFDRGDSVRDVYRLDLFTIDREGGLRVLWSDNDGWQGPGTIGPHGLFPPGAPVAASPQYGLLRQLDVFAVDVHGTLQVAWVSEDNIWKGPAPIGPPGVFPPGASVIVTPQYGNFSDTADYRGNNERLDLIQTDVLAVDRDGGLRVAWVVRGENWHSPASIGPTGVFPPGAPLAASRQYGITDDEADSIQTDIFGVDTNGGLRVAWVVPGENWNPPSPIGPSGIFPQQASVAVSPQYGADGTVGSILTHTYQRPIQTDVFAVDSDGGMRVAWVVRGDGWHSPAPLGPPRLFAPGTSIAASNQAGIDNQTDVFAVDPNGHLHVAWLLDGGNWNGPVRIS